ncbi:MAG: NAD(P)/FAD-dependent oxidoreductase [Kiritimatiellia bacterium]
MRYVVVGAGAAGAQAAEDLRKINPQGDILIIGDEAYPPYSRCLISRYVDGRLSEKNLYFKTTRFLDAWNLRGMFGVKVMAIDRQSRKILCDNGASYSYDRLLLATGSRPWLPPVPGLELRGVHTFHSLDDAKRVANLAKTAQAAVIVGAGLAGLEAAYALARRGLKVTVIERCTQILPKQFDQQSADMIVADLQAMGVEFLLNESIASIDGNECVASVTVGQNLRIPTDFVVVATGVTPNKDLAAAAGLETNEGVLVDDFLRTSDPNIYAAGDAIEIQDDHGTKRALSATWFNAILQGKYAAYNMGGTERRYTATVGMQNAVQFHRLPAILCGQILVEGGFTKITKSSACGKKTRAIRNWF